MNPCPSVLETAALPTELFPNRIKMNLFNLYITEIKYRSFMLLICSFCILLTSCFYKEILLFVLINASSYLSTPSQKQYFILTNVTEIFYVYTELILFVSSQAFIVGSVYHLWIFISFGLYKSEHKGLKNFFKLFILAWLFSVCMLHEILIPISWAFFSSFQRRSPFQAVPMFFEAKLAEYLEFYTSLYYVCLLNCQGFMFMSLFINNLGKNMRLIGSFRKLIYYLIVVFSTLVTPPDI